MLDHTMTLDHISAGHGAHYSPRALSVLRIGHPGGHLVARVVELYRHWRRARARAKARRQAIRGLSALGRHALHDIGLERSQIRSVVEAMLDANFPYPEPPGD